ncbi:MAG TPA: molybdenum cofactor biosynthesis protein MoaE [Fimbriimonadaceae bacterium]|nr:molybdenum cofactor biosynthesis protein MoaE [Fimbriimonadaceae bacterium]
MNSIREQGGIRKYNARMGLVCGCQLMTGPLDPEAIRRSVENLGYGSVVTLCAQVSGSQAGHTVAYSTDEATALQEMFAAAEEAVKRWDANVSLAQRLGDLIPGDISRVVVAACAEQAAAFNCCRFIADRIAERVSLLIA